MATKSIGATGRDYATLALHESYLDGIGTLSTAEIGECYNDGEFLVAGTVVTYSGFTASASNYVEIRPASGQGFKDASGAASAPQRYDQSKGVAVRGTNNYAVVVVVNTDYVTLRGLQIQYNANADREAFAIGNTSSSHSGLVDSIAESTGGTGGVVGMRSGFLTNCLLVKRVASSGHGFTTSYPGTTTLTNVTVVRPSDLTAGGDAFRCPDPGTVTLVNCAGFGFSNFVNDASKFAGSNNASDQAIGFGSSNQASKTYSSQFENTSDSTRDWRVKSTADLVNNGTATGAPAADIIGQTRSTVDIGCWEYTAAGGGITVDGDQGSATVTGQAATLRTSAAAAQGSATVTGQSATLRFSVAAAQGTVGVTGQSGTVAFMAAAAQGSMAVAGQSAAVSWQVAGEQGSVAIVGYDATLDLPGAITVLADTGTVTIVGYSAVFDLPEGVAPPAEEPSNAGGRIVAGTFTRKKWRALADAKRAKQEAEEQARQLKAKRRKAIEEAAQKAGEAIAAAEQAKVEEEAVQLLDRMAEALEAASNATAMAGAIREANETVRLANAVMRAVEDGREEEAVVSLLLM